MRRRLGKSEGLQMDARVIIGALRVKPKAMGGEDHACDVSVRRGARWGNVCAMLTSGRRINEGPGTFLERTPGLLQSRAYEGTFAMPLCPQFVALSSATGGVDGGQRKELSAV